MPSYTGLPYLLEEVRVEYCDCTEPDPGILAREAPAVYRPRHLRPRFFIRCSSSISTAMVGASRLFCFYRRASLPARFRATRAPRAPHHTPLLAAGIIRRTSNGMLQITTRPDPGQPHEARGLGGGPHHPIAACWRHTRVLRLPPPALTDRSIPKNDFNKVIPAICVNRNNVSRDFLSINHHRVHAHIDFPWVSYFDLVRGTSKPPV